jgi:hypothetical protein
LESPYDLGDNQGSPLRSLFAFSYSAKAWNFGTVQIHSGSQIAKSSHETNAVEAPAKENSTKQLTVELLHWPTGKHVFLTLAKDDSERLSSKPKWRRRC